MMTTPNYTTRSVTIPANGTVELYREAQFITCLSGAASFKVKVDNGPAFEMEAGLSVAFENPFTRLELIDESGANNLVKVALGKGGVKDARLVLTGQVDSREAAPDVLTTGAPISALATTTTALAAANAKRREVMVVNTDAATTIHVGGNAAAAAGQGVPVLAGQSLTLQTTAAVYARNDSVSAVAVAVAELEWSA